MTINDIIEAYQEILDEWQIFSDSQHIGITEDGRVRVCLRNYNWYVTNEPIKDPLSLIKAIFEIDWICEYDEEDTRTNVFYSKYWKRGY